MRKPNPGGDFDLLLDIRDRIPAGISRYGIGVACRVVPEMSRNGCRTLILAERHQRPGLLGMNSPGAGHLILHPPRTEAFIRFDDRVLELLRRFSFRYAHFTGPFADPRFCARFSATVHDLIRLHAGRASLHSDREFAGRYGPQEYANLRAARLWLSGALGASGEDWRGRSLEAYITWQTRFILARAEFMSVPSAGVREEVLRVVGPGHVGRRCPIRVHPPVVVPSLLFGSRLQAGAPGAAGVPDDPFILFVGTPDHHKRLDLVAGCLGAMWPRSERPVLAVVGDRAGENVFERLGTTTDYPVHRLGRVGDDVLGQLYRRALFTVLPSLHEGYGLPFDEALACGGRVVASDIPPFRERAAGRTGVALFHPQRPASFARAVHRVLHSTEGAAPPAASAAPPADTADALGQVLVASLAGRGAREARPAKGTPWS